LRGLVDPSTLRLRDRSQSSFAPVGRESLMTIGA
jgi:hypothetical protein